MSITESLKSWLIAIRAPGLGGKALIDAAGQAGGIDQLRSASSSAMRGFGLGEACISALRAPDEARLEADLLWLEQDGHGLLSWDCEDYPPLLRRIPSPPAALFVDGDPQVLWQPQVAVIGSRNPTVSGLEHAREFSAEFCRLGITVTSGLASGIDSAAHDAALVAGGQTVAVTGTGLDIVYPASSQSLAERIRQQGVLVSELPPGFPPRRGQFPARNRIISGLSMGVLVVEAGLNSGTLITARQAAEQGRDVFALPGSLHNPMVKGCHRLIREGARLAETVNDVLSELAPIAGELAHELRDRLTNLDNRHFPESAVDPGLFEDEGYDLLWSALANDPRSADELVKITGLPVQSVSSMLLMMEMHGKIAAHSSGRYCRVNNAAQA